MKKIANQDEDDNNDYQFREGWFITKKIHERAEEKQIEQESAVNKNELLDIILLNTMMNQFDHNLEINTRKHKTLLLTLAK